MRRTPRNNAICEEETTMKNTASANQPTDEE